MCPSGLITPDFAPDGPKLPGQQPGDEHCQAGQCQGHKGEILSLLRFFP